MYGIFTYIYHKNQPNVGIYTCTIHGSCGVGGVSLNHLGASINPLPRRSSGARDTSILLFGGKTYLPLPNQDFSGKLRLVDVDSLLQIQYKYM